MKNVLTIDVEDWYHANDLNIPVDEYHNYQDRIENSTKIFIDLLEKYNVKATFFVLGCVAEKHPNLLKSIALKGHEIGSHGYWHKLVYRQKPEEFKKELLRSKEVLEDIIGKQVYLYRAPSWSITENSLWALKILEEAGFKCDSSVHPVKTPLYGVKGAPTEPYYPVMDGKTLGILEFPPTVFQFWKFRFPIGGGLYLRFLPQWLTIKLLTSINRKKPALVYCHPWDADVNMPRLKVPPHIKFTHYYHLETTEKKVEALLQNFEFITLGESLLIGKYPALQIIK